MNRHENPLKILVVDDMPQNLLAMEALLAEDGIDVLSAPSGPAALEMLLMHDVAVALLDVQMPDMDGYALAELMRGTERTRHVPIIFLTAGSKEEQRSFRGYEAGAVDFLYKPIDSRVLQRKVQVFLDLFRQRRTLADTVDSQEQLARADAAMLVALSHDIRSQLAALSLNAELLLRRADVPGLRQTGVRVKSATALLSRQVDHLVNLAQRPGTDLRPELGHADLAAIVRDRLDEAVRDGLLTAPHELEVDGDTQGTFDVAMIGEAVGYLVLQAAAHANDQPVRIEVDGTSRRALALRLRLQAALPAQVTEHMLVGSFSADGTPTSRVGPGLAAPERLARVHGGSLIGRSNERDGTLLELVLPRGPMPSTSY